MKYIRKNTKKYKQLREECLSGDKLLYQYFQFMGMPDYLCDENIIEFWFDNGMAKLIELDESIPFSAKTNHKQHLQNAHALYFFYRPDQDKIEGYIKHNRKKRIENLLKEL